MLTIFGPFDRFKIGWNFRILSTKRLKVLEVSPKFADSVQKINFTPMDKWQISSNLGWKKYTSRGLIFTYKLIKFWKYWRQRGLQDLCTCGQLNMYKLKPEVRQTFCVQRYHQNLLIRPAKARVTFYSTNITFFYSSKLSAIFVLYYTTHVLLPVPSAVFSPEYPQCMRTLLLVLFSLLLVRFFSSKRRRTMKV